MNLCFAGLSPAISGMLWEHPLNPEPPRSPQPTTRWERTGQATLFNVFAEHEIGRELKAMPQCLDEQRLLLGLIAADLRGHGIKDTGRHGLPAEAVLRCALLKQKSATELHGIGLLLEESASFRAFARLPLAWTPKKSVLQQTIARSARRLGGDQPRLGGAHRQHGD